MKKYIEYFKSPLGVSTLITIGLGIILILFNQIENRMYKNTPIPKSIVVYYQTSLQYTFKDGTKDTTTVNVYENPNQVTLTDGDLQYWKITGATGGAVAGVCTIASYVRSFNILKADRMQIVEK